MNKKFPQDFVWGVATASYQIEGAYNEDGRALSIWDAFCEQDGKVLKGHNGNVACDHYHRYKEDVRIMKELGIKAYRFSIAWPRIMPNGTGFVNPQGIEFYNNLIDELISNGIEPFVTLYHWDLPLALYDKGGWLNPDSPEWFKEYARVIADNFSDRVKYFITFNEPQCFIGLGYVTGLHAPGLKLSLRDTVLMSHHVLKGHGLAVKTLREFGKQPLKIGYAPTADYAYPSDENNPSDIEAAKKLTFEVKNGDNWAWNVSWWSDPVFFGEYPKDGLAFCEKFLPEGWREDLKIINQPLDFLGQNLYTGYEVKASPDGTPEIVSRYDGHPRTAIGWPIEPKALKWCVKFLYERYKLPIYITENGLSCADVVSVDGNVHDPNRIDFLQRYLFALYEAMAEGAEVLGYFQWSIMDNFEWAFGYTERFGIVYIDYTTQQRIIKDSAYWYKNLIETGCLE